MSVDLDELRRLRRARTALMSAAHFSRRFREAYGETPYAYLLAKGELYPAHFRSDDLDETFEKVAATPGAEVLSEPASNRLRLGQG